MTIIIISYTPPISYTPSPQRWPNSPITHQNNHRHIKPKSTQVSPNIRWQERGSNQKVATVHLRAHSSECPTISSAPGFTSQVMAALTFLAGVVGSIGSLRDILQLKKYFHPLWGKVNKIIELVHHSFTQSLSFYLFSFSAEQVLNSFSEYLFDICYVTGRLKTLHLHPSGDQTSYTETA